MCLCPLIGFMTCYKMYIKQTKCFICKEMNNDGVGKSIFYNVIYIFL